MLVVDTGLSMQDYEAITESREWGPEGVDTFWQARSVGIAKFTSWELSFSYVNNFVDVFTDYQCGRGGIPDFDFAFGGCEWEDDSLTSNEIYLTFVKYPFPGREPKSRDPFDVIVSSLYGEEVVTVTKWGYCAQDSKYCHGPKYDSRRQLGERKPTSGRGAATATATPGFSTTAGSAYGTGTASVTAAARQTVPALGIRRSDVHVATPASKLKRASKADGTTPPTGHHSQKLVSQKVRDALAPGTPNVVPGKPNVVRTPPTLKSDLKSALKRADPKPTAPSTSTSTGTGTAAVSSPSHNGMVEAMKERADRAFQELMSRPAAEPELTPDADTDADAEGRRLDGTCYTLVGKDSYGDGWDGGSWTWTDDDGAVTTGTLEDGDSEQFTLCPGSGGCGVLYVDGGSSYPAEQSWELFDAAGSVIDSGGADIEAAVCDGVVVVTPSPTAGPTPSPTTPATDDATDDGTAPSPSPTGEPTVPPTPLPTFTPTSGPTPLPTTPLPTFNPTYGPTPLPTTPPSPLPTSNPTASPTPLPTTPPSPLPTSNPTPGPSPGPTPEPSIPIVWDDGGADGGEYGYADDNDDADDDAAIDPLFLLSFLTSGGNEPGYVKVDRAETAINHAGTDSGAFLYYVYGPNAEECLEGSCLPDGIPADWKCDGANYYAADGVW